MRTSILALALASVAPVAVQAQSPTWQTDYATAYRTATTEQRPMALVFGQGVDGWQQIVGGGSLTKEATQALTNNYVPCYVDTTTPAGKAIAKRFGMDGPVGLVLSDRTGGVQALWHQGILSADTLTSHLTRYGDPNRVATTTDLNPGPGQRSHYPPIGGAYSSAYPPTVGGLSSYPAGGCPTCSSCSGGSCGRRR
jgi:hypothetical protein